MSEQQNLEISQQFYTLMAQDDCLQVVSLLAEEIDWHGLTLDEGRWQPKRLQGCQAVIDFLRMSNQIIKRTWTPETLLLHNDRVIILGQGKYLSKITQYCFENEFIHLLKFKENKITEFITYFDTDTVLLLANHL